MRYTNPVPQGRIGRTDMGVDISAPPGTPVYAIADETEVGVIQDWYKGQPFAWFWQAGTNTYNYVAEQITNLRPIGTRFKAGDVIGTVAPSGTGLEVGYAARGGRTLAQATTGYREGQATPAGRRYRSEVLGGGSFTAGNGPVQWLQQAGWPNRLIPIMVAIGGAESGWRIDATHTNDNGTTDDGWLQVNSSHGFNRTRLLSDPVYCARAAYSVYKKQGLRAWSTYNSGAYTAYMGRQATGGFGRTRPGGDEPTGPTPETELAAFFSPLPPFNNLPNPGDLFKNVPQSIHGITDFLKWIGWMFHPLNILRVAEFNTGFPLILLGIWIMVKEWQGAARQSPIRMIRRGVARSPTPVGRAMKTVNRVSR